MASGRSFYSINIMQQYNPDFFHYSCYECIDH